MILSKCVRDSIDIQHPCIIAEFKYLIGGKLNDLQTYNIDFFDHANMPLPAY